MGGQFKSRGFERENKVKVEGGGTCLLDSVIAQWKESGFCGFMCSVHKGLENKTFDVYFCLFVVSFVLPLYSISVLQIWLPLKTRAHTYTVAFDEKIAKNIKSVRLLIVLVGDVIKPQLIT